MTEGRRARPHEVEAASRDPRLLRAREASTRNLEWRTRGRCRTVDPETFFPLPTQPADMALALCRGCDVQPDCLAFALNEKDQEGIWGATTPRERRAMLPTWTNPVAEPVPVEAEPVLCPEGHTMRRDTNDHRYCPQCRSKLALRSSTKRRAGAPVADRPCVRSECDELLDELAPSYQRYCTLPCRRKAKTDREQTRQPAKIKAPTREERNAARAEQVRSLADTGLSDATIGRRIGVRENTVWAIRNRHSIPPGRRVAQARWRDQVRQLLNDGLADKAIAGRLGVAVSTVAYQRSCIRAEDLRQVSA